MQILSFFTLWMDCIRLVLSGLSPVPGTVVRLKGAAQLNNNTLLRVLHHSSSGQNKQVNSKEKEFHLLYTFFPAGKPQKLLLFFFPVFSRKKNTYFLQAAV